MQTQENAAANVGGTASTSVSTAASALERRIDMAIAKADIDKEVQQRLRHIAKTVKMPGFRPGKVPMNIVAQQYGSQAHSEAIGAAVEKAFSAKVQEQNLRIAGYPRIEPKATTGEGAMEFSAVFEVYPDVVLGDVSGRELERATLTVGDAEIDKTIDVLRKQRTSYVSAGRAAEDGDRMTIDFTGRKSGEEFQGGRATDYPVMLGSGMMLPDFECGLRGMKEGETKNFDVKFPDDYHAKDLAGNTVQFEATCRKVEAPKIPEVDADFAKALGIKDGDLGKMREEVKANLEREVKKRLQARIKNQVMDALLAVNDIAVPKALVEAESKQMAENALKDLQSRGMDAKNMPVDASWFTDQAVRRVKLGLVLAELVRAKDLHAKPEQVRAIVDDYSQTFEDPKEVVRWYYGQPQRLAEAEALAMENNVVDWALANAKVVDKAVSFDELMGNAA
jgi:trigger factor